MDTSSDTSNFEAKKPMRPCPRCPHRLSDLWAHETTPEPEQPTSEALETGPLNKDDGNGDESSSTTVGDQVDQKLTSRLPPDYPDTASEQSHSPKDPEDEQGSNVSENGSSEYHELGSDDENQSSDDHETYEDYKTAKEYQSDEEHLLGVHLRGGGPEDACEFCKLFPPGSKCPLCAPTPPYAKKNLEEDSEVKMRGGGEEDRSSTDFVCRPAWYTCFCGQNHALPGQGEKIDGEEQEELSKAEGGDEVEKEMTANDGVMEETFEDGHWILWKLCDRCEEINRLELAGEFDDPRLWKLRAEAMEYAEADEQDSGQFEEWKQFVEDALPLSQPEQASEGATVSKPLSTVAEEEEK